MEIDRRTYKKLTGKSAGASALMVTGGIFILIGIVLLIFLSTTLDMKTGVELGLFLFLIAFYVGLLIVFVTLIVRRASHARDLKAKLDSLNSSERLQVAELARNYRGSFIDINDKYLYGNMSRISKGSPLERNVIGFEYLPLGNIAWVYFINPRITPKMEATIVGACAGLIMGSVIKNTPSEYADMAHYVRDMQFQPRSENRVCVFLRDGSCYKGICNANNYDRLREAIWAHNPSCKFGFNKEVLQEFM